MEMVYRGLTLATRIQASAKLVCVAHARFAFPTQVATKYYHGSKPCCKTSKEVSGRSRPPGEADNEICWCALYWASYGRGSSVLLRSSSAGFFSYPVNCYRCDLNALANDREGNHRLHV
jgi:hypothetical protein